MDMTVLEGLLTRNGMSSLNPVLHTSSDTVTQVERWIIHPSPDTKTLIVKAAASSGTENDLLHQINTGMTATGSFLINGDTAIEINLM